MANSPRPDTRPKDEQAKSDFSEARLWEILGSRPFRYERQAASTNDLAREWALAGAPTGSVVIADEQTQGRGRFGRTWLAPAGTALLMSVILRPRLDPARLSRMMLVGAVATVEALSSYLPDRICLKWPNDVHLDHRKVGGILSEASWQGETLNAIVLGIGLNVRVDFTGTPFADRAISLESLTDQPIDRVLLLSQLLQAIERWLLHLNDDSQSDLLLSAWRDRLSTIGQQVTARAVDHVISGQAVDVDSDGALLLRAVDGTIHRIVAGEVTLADVT